MFKQEKELVSLLKGNLTCFYSWNVSKHSAQIFEEVNLGYGIADIVISKIGKTNDTLTSVTKLSYFDITVLKIIEQNKQTEFSYIKSLTKSSTSSVKKALGKLILNSYIQEQDMLYIINKKYDKVVLESIAIEAKLKNWKRALNQAFRYKWFADKVFVVLDSAHSATAVKNIEEFRRLNVGLAEINIQGETFIHCKPSKQEPINKTMKMLFNEQVKQSLLAHQK